MLFLLPFLFSTVVKSSYPKKKSVWLETLTMCVCVCVYASMYMYVLLNLVILVGITHHKLFCCCFPYVFTMLKWYLFFPTHGTHTKWNNKTRNAHTFSKCFILFSFRVIFTNLICNRLTRVLMPVFHVRELKKKKGFFCVHHRNVMVVEYKSSLNTTRCERTQSKTQTGNKWFWWRRKRRRKIEIYSNDFDTVGTDSYFKWFRYEWIKKEKKNIVQFQPPHIWSIRALNVNKKTKKKKQNSFVERLSI